MKLKGIPKVSRNQPLKIRISVLDETIPMERKINEIFTKTLASLTFFSEKLFARNRCNPSGIPMIAIFAKISEREITSAKLPIVSVVVNFVTSIQNIYPAIMDDRNCRYRYIVPLPTAGLNKFYPILAYLIDQ
jgi:hypothetical protein